MIAINIGGVSRLVSSNTRVVDIARQQAGFLLAWPRIVTMPVPLPHPSIIAVGAAILTEAARTTQETL